MDYKILTLGAFVPGDPVRVLRTRGTGYKKVFARTVGVFSRAFNDRAEIQIGGTNYWTPIENLELVLDQEPADWEEFYNDKVAALLEKKAALLEESPEIDDEVFFVAKPEVRGKVFWRKWSQTDATLKTPFESLGPDGWNPRSILRFGFKTPDGVTYWASYSEIQSTKPKVKPARLSKFKNFPAPFCDITSFRLLGAGLWEALDEQEGVIAVLPREEARKLWWKGEVS